MISQAQRSLLAKIAFFLCHDGFVPEAEKIFTALSISAPDKEGPIIGLALCRILSGASEEAVQMLDICLANPDCTLKGPLSLYRLVALSFGGRFPEAAVFRKTMEEKGLNAYLKDADGLLEELTKLKESGKIQEKK
jgi:hypothetical protein